MRHVEDQSTDTLIVRAQACVGRGEEMPLDIYYELINRGINAAAIAGNETEDESTAGLVQHSQD